MRLQLILLLVALPAAAQEEERSSQVVSKVGLYTDDDDTRVVTSLVDAEIGLPAGLSASAHVLVDSVSSASVDVVSSATERWTENRVEAGARLGARLGRNDVSLGVVRSAENDYLSWGVQVLAGRELAQKNTRVQLGYGFADNMVGRNEDPTFERSLRAHTAEAGATQLLSPTTILGLTYTFQIADGYQASPYRYVLVADGTMALPEAHPERRTRHAVTARLLHSLSEAMAFDASYRLYGDDWGIVSHTVTASWLRDLGRSWDLRLRVRGYRQSAADFYRESYAQPMLYMSGDRELGTFWDAGGGIRLGWHAGGLTVEAKVEGIYDRFLDYAYLEGRAALVSDVGASYAW